MPILVQGEGTFAFTVTAPVGWTVLNGAFTQTVSTQALLLVTVQVGQHAAPGPEHLVTVTAFADGKAVASAAVPVTVDKAAGVEVQAPSDIQSFPGQPHGFSVVVTNTGNFEDSYTLSVTGTIFPANVAPRSVTLAPEASTTIRVSVTPSGRVSNGYSQVVTVKAVSETDDTATAQVRVTDAYLNPALPNQNSPGHTKAPQLVFGVSSQLNGQLVLGDHLPQGSLDYSLTPTLYGDLSDFVYGSLVVSGLSGSLTQPLPGFGGVTVGLTGDSWNASLTAGLDSVGLSGGLQLGDWQVAGTSGYSWSTGGYGVQLSSEYQTTSSSLRLSGQLQRTPFEGAMYGNDSLAVSYSRYLGAGISGTFGVSAQGLQQPNLGYVVIPSIDEKLAWQGSQLQFTQSYDGQPTLGLHTLSLDGGMRSLSPIGVRTTDVLQLSDGAYRLSGIVGLYGTTLLLPPSWYGSALSNLNLRLVAGVDLGTAGSLQQQFEVNPGIAFTLVQPGGVSVYGGASYQHYGGLGNLTASDRYQLDVGAMYANLSSYAVGTYQRSFQLGPGLSHNARFDFSAAYTPTAMTQFRVDYGYRDTPQVVLGGNLIQDTGSADWLQYWTPGLSTDVAYNLDLYPHVPALSTHNVTLTLTYAPVVLPALNVSASYQLGSPFGQWSTRDLNHTFTFKVGYALAVPFATPKVVVDAFGGRKTGAVMGRAYVVEAGGSKRPLAGLDLHLGDTVVTTSADGSFDARVPVGTYQVTFGKGLPATVGYFGIENVTVERNKVLRLDLPFQPVGSVAVFLYDDTNRNGVHDAGENGIPYGGVTLDGPVRKTVRVDAAGHALVTDLPAGIYRVTPDTAHLPTGYVATSAPLRLDLQAGAREVPVAVGAAVPAPKVITTFTQGGLSMLVNATPLYVPPGAEVALTVQANGPVDAVSATFEGASVKFHQSGNDWVARPRVPFGAAPGPVSVTVTAHAGASSVSQDVTINVVRGPAFRAAKFQFVAGSKESLEVDTLFKARQVAVELPGGVTVALHSADGYHWTGTYTVPAEPGDIVGTVKGDGHDLGTIDIAIEAPPAGGKH